MEIIFIEVVDLFEINFSFKNHLKIYKKDKPLSYYFPNSDELCFISSKYGEVFSDHIVEEDEGFVFAPHMGNKVAAALVAIVAVVIIGMFTFGVGFGASGMFLTSAGALTTAGQVLFSVAFMALSTSLSILMMPKPPDAPDGPDSRSVYLWGDNRTKSQMMLPIPIVCGTFTVPGNLISDRTKPVPVKSAYDPLKEVGLYLFGLTSNQIEEISEIYLNKLPASDMTSADLTIFYTDGSPEQPYVYALPERTNSAPHITRFKLIQDTGDTNQNQNLSDYEPFSPGKVIEQTVQMKMTQPSHTHLGYVFENNETPLTFLDKKSGWDVFGSLTRIVKGSDELSEIAPGTNPDFIEVSLFKTPPETIDVDILNRSTTEEAIYPDYYIEIKDSAGNSVYQRLPPVSIGEDIYLTYRGSPKSTDSIHHLSTEETQILQGTVSEYIYNELPVPPDNSYIDILEEGYQYFNIGLKISISYQTITNIVIPIKGTLSILKQEEVGDLELERYLDPLRVDYSNESNWHTLRSTITDADDIEIDFVFPEGLNFIYSIKQHKKHTWVIFDWLIRLDTENNETYFTYFNNCDPENPYSLFPVENIAHEKSAFATNSEDAPHKWHCGAFYSTDLAFVHNSSLLNILTSKYGTTYFSYPKIPVIEDNTTGERRLKHGTYTIKIRIKDHGIANSEKIRLIRVKYPDGSYKTIPINSSYAHVFPPEIQKVPGLSSVETLKYSVNLFRMKEFVWDKTITYPYTSIAGISMIASEKYQGALPNFAFICKGKFYVWKGGTSTDYTNPNNWNLEYSNNPSYICLNLFIDSYYGAAIADYGSTNLTSEFLTEVGKKLDFSSFIEFADYCDEPTEIKGLVNYPGPDWPDDINEYQEDYTYVSSENLWKPKRYVCHGLIDSQNSVLDWVNKILGSYDAKFIYNGSSIGIIYEKQYDPFIPMQVFTSSNIIENSFSQKFIDPSLLATSVETTFLDQENYFEKTPVLYRLAESILNPNKKTRVNLFGYTNINRVINRLHEILQKTNVLSQLIEFSTSTQGFRRKVGDPIGVTHEFIEWGVINEVGEDELVQVSGRILKIDTTNNYVYLDRIIALQDIPFDFAGKGRVLLLISNKTDDFNNGSLYMHITDSINDSLISPFTVLKVEYPTNIQSIDLSFFESEDLFLIGKKLNEYKKAVITKLSYESNNLVKISATIYNDEMWDKDRLSITTISGTLFNASLLGILECNLTYTEETEDMLQSAELSWNPPAAFSNNSTISEGKYTLKFLRYEIYKKTLLVNPEEDLADQDISSQSITKWEYVGSTTNLNFTDTNLTNSSCYVYKVTSILQINGIEVYIPLSWNTECRIKTTYKLDYLPAVKNIEFQYKTDTIEGNNYITELTIICDKVIATKENWNNMLLVWLKLSKAPYTEWYGNSNLRLTRTVNKGDKYIYVNTLSGLPIADIQTKKPFGLVILDHEEIVFIDGGERTVKNDYRLHLRYYDRDPEGEKELITQNSYRRYYLSRQVEIGSIVEDAHRGFYPIKYFAVIEDNNIVSQFDSFYLKFDSIYFTEYLRDTNSILHSVVKKVTPSNSDVVADFTAASLNHNYYRTNLGGTNLISAPKSSGVLTSNKFFLEVFNKDNIVSDFELSYAYKTCDEEPHTILASALSPCPEIQWLKTVKDLPNNKITATWGNLTIPADMGIYVGVTSDYTLGEGTEQAFGYTSFPVAIKVKDYE